MLWHHRSVLGLLPVAAALLAAPAAAQDGRRWLPEERFIISDFSELGAVASDMRRVYAASPNGIQIYDAVAERWERPLTAESGFPAGRRPSALAHDRGRDVLWLGTEEGDLYSYAVHFGRWESHGFLVGGIRRIVIGPDLRESGVYILTGTGWYRITMAGGPPMQVDPRSIPAAVLAEAGPPQDRIARDDPAFLSQASSVTMDRRFRRFPIVDAAPGQRPQRWWLATRGGNLFLYDGFRGLATHMTFGAVSRSVTALGRDGGALWFGGDGCGARRGVARGGVDLQNWRSWYDDDGAPAGAVRAIAATAGAVWFAASDGVYRFDRRESWRRITEADGLLGETTSLAPDPGGGVWVGTRRGVALLGDDGRVIQTRAMGARRVHALHAGRDTLWIGSEAGLFAIDLTTEGAAPQAMQLAVRLVGVSYGPDGALWAAAEDAVYRRGVEGWEGPIRQPAVGGAGRITHLSSAAGHLWVGGTTGIARLDDGSVWTMYRVGEDLPDGPVLDIVVAGNELWAATRGGAVRLRWRR